MENETINKTKPKMHKLNHLMYFVWINEISSYSIENGSQILQFPSLFSDKTLAYIIGNRIVKDNHYELLQKCFQK